MKNPVVLIHGIDDTRALFRRMEATLQSHGWETHALDLHPNNGSAGLQPLAAQVADFVERTFPAGSRIDIVGFSMGGVVSRVYVQTLGGIERVERLITISSPHSGTWCAYGRFNKGASEMRPGSPLLRHLNAGTPELCQSVRVTSIWSRFDLMILPATSSIIQGANNICVNVPAHAIMMNNPRVQSLIMEALGA